MSDLNLVQIEAVSLFKKYGFETRNKSILDLSLGDGERLTADVRGYQSSRIYTQIDIRGVGVKQSRRVTYESWELDKLESRIKRLVNNAKKKVHDQIARKEKYVLAGEKIVAVLREKSISSVATIWGTAEIVVNGYHIEVRDDLLVHLSVGYNKTNIDVSAAISILTALPKGNYEV